MNINPDANINHPCVCIAVALPIEARLLCDTFKCRQLQDNHFTLFARQDLSLVIIVSGVGRLAMASAIAYFCGAYHRKPILLNFGIAGSQEFARGDLVTCHKLYDASSDKNYYPDFSWQQKLPSCIGETREQHSDVYPEQGVVDLEATGFYASSQQFVVRENIRVLKLVSDNHVEQAARLDKTQVQCLIQAQLDPLRTAVEELCHLSQTLKPYENLNYQRILPQCHFTQTQSHQLYDWCRRYEALFQDVTLAQQTKTLPNAKQIITFIEQLCAAATPSREIT